MAWFELINLGKSVLLDTRENWWQRQGQLFSFFLFFFLKLENIFSPFFPFLKFSDVSFQKFEAFSIKNVLRDSWWRKMTVLPQEFHRTTLQSCKWSLIREEKNCCFLTLILKSFIWDQAGPTTYFQFVAGLKVISALGFLSSSDAG